MDARTKGQLIGKLELLARSPTTMSGVKPMAREWAGSHRQPHGVLRVIYMSDRANQTVVVAHVGHAATRTNKWVAAVLAVGEIVALRCRRVSVV